MNSSNLPEPSSESSIAALYPNRKPIAKGSVFDTLSFTFRLYSLRP